MLLKRRNHLCQLTANAALPTMGLETLTPEGTQTTASIPAPDAKDPPGNTAARAPGTLKRSPTRYDLLTCNLVFASIAALLMATAGSSIKVVQILERASVAGF